MVYTPVYTTKSFIISITAGQAIFEAADLPDEIMEMAEARITAWLLENGRFALADINQSDFRLKMAATYAVLFEMQTSGIIRGYFGQSGEIITKGAIGVSTILSQQNRGGHEAVPQQIDRTQGTPDNWNQMMYYLRLYHKDPLTEGNRIDEVHLMASNFQDTAVQNLIKNKQYNAFKNF